MHHAYPRECPFPHDTGALSTFSDASERTDEDNIASVATMREHVAARLVVLDDEQAELPWTDIEELLIVSPPALVDSEFASYSLTAVTGNIMILAAMVSLALSLAGTAKKALIPMKDTKFDRYSV